MISILYLQKNPFYSIPVLAETLNGHFILTDKKGKEIYNQRGADLQVKFTLAWGITIKTSTGTIRLYANASGFSPSPSKQQVELSRSISPQSMGDLGAISGIVAAGAMIDSNELIKQWRGEMRRINAVLTK